MAPIQSQEPMSISIRSATGSLKPQVPLLPSMHLKDTSAAQQSVQESLSSALSSTFPALTAQYSRGPKKDAKASRQAIMDLLHPEQPPLLVNTHFAPEGRPYSGAAATAPPPASEFRLRPITKPSQARSPPNPPSLLPDKTQPAISPNEMQPIVGQGVQLLDDSPPREEGMDSIDPAWFRSTGARPDLQAATSVGPTWDSPETSKNPRGVSGRIPIAPLPAMSLPAPLRMGPKSLASADLEADQVAPQAPLSLQKSMEVLARLRAPSGGPGQDTALWLQLTASGATANADEPVGQANVFPASADAHHPSAVQRPKPNSHEAETLQPPRTPKRSECPTKGNRPGREPSLDGSWLQDLMEHEMAMLDEATLAAKEALHAHGIQRHALPLRLPLNARQFADRLAVCIRDSAGVPTLLALPSDRPSLRQEAVAVEMLLTDAIAQPPHSLELAAAWRAHSLLEFCNTSMTALSAGGIPQASHAWATAPASMPNLPTTSLPARPAGGPVQSALIIRQPSRAQTEGPLNRTQTLGGTGTGSHTASRTDPAINILTQSLRRPQRVAFNLISGVPGSPSHASTPLQPPGNHSITHAAGSLAWDMHCVGCLAAAASVAMADLVRQVEVGCAQRGRSLALTWNLQTACTEAALSRAESITEAATDLQAHCEAQAMQLDTESKTASALRREVSRRRQECEAQKTDYLKLHDVLEDRLVQLNTVKGELAQINAWSKRRMARLRWQHAIATITTLRAMGHSEIPKPDPFAVEAPARSNSNLLSQMEATETLARDTAKVQRRKSIMVKAVEEFKNAQLDASEGRRGFNAVGKLSGSEMLSLASSGSEEQAAALMTSLSPEARAMLLINLDTKRRRCVLKAMKHEQNAAILVSMNQASRKSILEDLDANGDMHGTMDVIRKRPQFTSKWIVGLTGKELEAEIAALSSEQMTALLTHLKPHLAAELLQELGPRMAAKPLQRLSVDNAGRVLSAMSPRAAVSNLLVADNPWAFNTLKSMKESAAQAILDNVDIDSAAQLMNGLVERDRLTFMDILPEDLREDVQNAFQARQARKWGGNAALEGLAALEAIPDPEQMAPFKSIGFSEKVRLLSAMTPAQISAILGIYTKEDAANMIDSMAPGVRDAIMNTLMEPALHAVEAVARQATLGDKNDASVEEVLRAASETIEQLNSFSRLASIASQGSIQPDSARATTPSKSPSHMPASPRTAAPDDSQAASLSDSAGLGALSAEAALHSPDITDASPHVQAGREEAALPSHAASISHPGRRGSSGIDHHGKAATDSSHTPKGSRYADSSGEAAVVAAVRAKLASGSGKLP
ncbi:hypothetical protein WJX74_000684 [Apatococcus lobatus]|uniref:Magnesium transporter MgtE intracellular domain-containing protein n=1 Tax=Apatococcus lobatus TaxID=904363 RepID=A0AAW1QJE2_9CHLO